MAVAHSFFNNIFLICLTLFLLSQTILSVASSLSGISSQMTSRDLNRNDLSTNQEFNNSLEAIVPDGTQSQILYLGLLSFAKLQ